MYHKRGCTLIYQLLSYPFRSLYKMNRQKVELKTIKSLKCPGIQRQGNEQQINHNPKLNCTVEFMIGGIKGCILILLSSLLPVNIVEKVVINLV